jgi:tetratricopeptide (TPR) repeat protein
MRSLPKIVMIALAWLLVGGQEAKVFAQSSLPKAVNDSLWAVWKDTKQPDTSRLKAMNVITWDGYVYSLPDSSFHFAQMMYDLAMSKGQKKFAALALYTQGAGFYIKNDFDKALDYYGRSLRIRQEMGEMKGKGSSIMDMKHMYKDKGEHVKAIDHYMRALKFCEESGVKGGMTACIDNIGIIYDDEGNHGKSIEHYTRSLKTQEKTGNKAGMAGTLSNLGLAYAKQGDTAKAILQYQSALTILEEVGDKAGAATCLNTIGSIYFYQSEYDRSLVYHRRSLAIRKEIGDKLGMATTLINIGDIHLTMGDHVRAIELATQALYIAQEVGAVVQLEQAANVLYASYKTLGQYSKALEMHELYIQMRDRLATEKNQRETMRHQFQNDYDKKETLMTAQQEKKDAVSAEHLRRREIYMWAAAAIALLLAFMSFMGFFAYRTKARLNGVLEKKNHVIGEQKKEITDSIRYAERIQHALLPDVNVLHAVFPDSFIIHKPKDIVSGDFYWLHDLPDRIYFAVVDCTGHGVPGAFMSFLGTSALNRAVTDLRLVLPSDILFSLSAQVSELLHSDQGADINDGMDLTLCCYFKEKKELHYAGAYNPLWVLRKGEMEVIKGDKQPVGNMSNHKPFTNHIVPVAQGDVVYLFSDGYADQFGGTDDKKIGTGKFRAKLTSIGHLPVKDQRAVISDYFDIWKGEATQVDDVCLMGIRI